MAGRSLVASLAVAYIAHWTMATDDPSSAGAAPVTEATRRRERGRAPGQPSSPALTATPALHGIPLSALQARSQELRAAYTSARPFRHLVIDDFLAPETVSAIVDEEFGDVASARWLVNRHFSQRMHSRVGARTRGPAMRGLLEALAGPALTRWVEDVTATGQLFADPEMTDGGLGAMGPGDFLDLHHDMLVHPRRRQWRRHVNLVIYLNAGWRPAWGGELELWSGDATHRCAAIAPRAGRAVLFEVGRGALHGVPRPVTCPPGEHRKSLALYYFRRDAGRVSPLTLRYRRPRSGPLTRALVAANNVALVGYDLGRKYLGLRDEPVSRLLRALRMRSGD